MKSGERSVLCCSVVKEKESFLYKDEREEKHLCEDGVKEQGHHYPLSEVWGCSSKEERDIRCPGGSSCPKAGDLVPVLTDDDYDSIARDTKI